MNGKAIILAMRPEFWNLIALGIKTIELRRCAPARLHAGQRVFFYCKGCLVGEASVENFMRGRAEDVARQCWRGSSLSYDQALAYLEEGRSPAALELHRVMPYKKPRTWHGHAPQNFIYR